MIKKLRLKFICINMTIVTIMLILIMGMVVQFTKFKMSQAGTQMLSSLASNPLYLIKPNDRLKVNLPYFSVRLDSHGELVEYISSSYDLPDQNYLQEIIDKSYCIHEKTGVLEEYQLRYMHVDTPVDRFIVFIDMSHEITTINTLTRNCIFTGFLGFFIFLGISIFLANWAVKPVERAWSQQKQFIADASHELKTPLTVILTNAELLQNPTFDSDKKSHFAKCIYQTAAQMRNLVEGLLELSRIDNGMLKSEMELQNFSTLVRDSVYCFEPLFFENNLILEADIEPELYLHAAYLQLKQVVDILLDNAMKYSTPNTQVNLELSGHGNNCELSISNHGDTISPKDLKNIFRRFYRIDQSRSGSGSYGLGLSIAQEIIHSHHGEIGAESTDGVTTFYVRLPLCI